MKIQGLRINLQELKVVAQEIKARKPKLLHNPIMERIAMYLLTLIGTSCFQNPMLHVMHGYQNLGFILDTTAYGFHPSKVKKI